MHREKYNNVKKDRHTKRNGQIERHATIPTTQNKQSTKRQFSLKTCSQQKDIKQKHNFQFHFSFFSGRTPGKGLH